MIVCSSRCFILWDWLAQHSLEEVWKKGTLCVISHLWIRQTWNLNATTSVCTATTILNGCQPSRGMSLCTRGLSFDVRNATSSTIAIVHWGATWTSSTILREILHAAVYFVRLFFHLQNHWKIILIHGTVILVVIYGCTNVDSAVAPLLTLQHSMDTWVHMLFNSQVKENRRNVHNKKHYVCFQVICMHHKYNLLYDM